MKYFKTILILFLLVFASDSLAQTTTLPGLSSPLDYTVENKEANEVIIDWQAITYSPWWYQGRKLPTVGSKIKLGLTFLKPLKDNLYYIWVVDDKKTNQVPDSSLKEIIFEVKDFSVPIELKIFEKKISKAGKESFDVVEQYYMNLIVVDPEAVIYSLKNKELSYQAETTVTSGEKKSFLAIPYFFNINQPKDLKFSWQFLGKTISGANLNPNLLDLNIQKASRVSYSPLSVSVSNEDSSQTASGELNLKIQ